MDRSTKGHDNTMADYSFQQIALRVRMDTENYQFQLNIDPVNYEYHICFKNIQF